MILKHTLTKPLEEVFLYLSDMQKFAEVHPVIYKVDQLGDSEYLFYEKIKFAFIPFDFNYKVNLKNVLFNQSIEMDSQVQKGVHLRLKFSFQSKNNSTEVQEEIIIKANSLVKIIFQKVIKKAHKTLFQNIEKK